MMKRKNDQSEITAADFENVRLRPSIVGMFAGTTAVAVVGVPVYAWNYGIDGFTWTMFGVFLTINNLSITTGYHRMWAHKSFEGNIVVRFLLALGGAFALQNSILKWASDHRRHHGHVDDVLRDPYCARRGFWYSHMGWMIRDYPSAFEDFSNVVDLEKDPIARYQYKYYLPLAVALNVGIPLAIGFAHGNPVGMLLVVGFLRLVVGHHTTFFINSLAHIMGRQPYSQRNTARDNAIMALLTFGEGYHNYHHAFPGDYRNAIKWWQWDPTKWLIYGMRIVGLARKLRTASPQRIS
jgi:stearoyl-CoA desaturase (Delta-9 desaturase)